MRWECSECGTYVDDLDAPSICHECGTAGVIFVPIEVDDPMVGDPEADSLGLPPPPRPPRSLA